MRSPLIYLTLAKLKNQIKAVFKSPAKLIYALFLIALLSLTFFTKKDFDSSELRDLSELTAILTLFYTAIFFMVFGTGSASNTPILTLSDATLLFPAPISPNRILFYGLFRQMGVSLLLGLFLLFQYSWLNSLYGITYLHLVFIILGYALVLFLAQFCSMAVYTRTSGKENAKRIVWSGLVVAVLLYATSAAFVCKDELMLALESSNYGPLLAAGTSFFSTLPGLLFPVSGWSAAMIDGFITGNMPQAFLFLLISAVFFGILVLLIVKCKNNYYEDVLQTAEVAHSAITAQKEGKLNEAVPKNVRVGKIGLKKGVGASAVFYKHKVENRRSGVFFLSNMSLLFAVILIVFAFFLQKTDVLIFFSAATYMQLFTTALGRFNRELTKPFLYLIPEPPLKKLLYAVKESLLTNFWEAVLLFAIVGFIFHLTPLEVVCCILARVSFSILFTAGNILVERVFGTFTSKALIFFFYFFSLLLLSVPGLIVGGVCMTFFTALGESAAFLFGMTVANIPVAILIFFLCRNLLQYAEFNNN